MSDSLRDALEKLVEQKSSEPDRRPRDKYGPIGRKAEPTIRVSMLRDMLAAHPVEPVNAGEIRPVVGLRGRPCPNCLRTEQHTPSCTYEPAEDAP